MARIEKTVFISYRRRDISWALAVYQYLTGQKYDVFFDFSSLSSGDFEQVIVSNIKARAHFLVILTPTALDRCSNPGDWLRREIETAIDEKRNIIPLFFDGFSFGSPSIAEKLTGNLATLNRYNGLDIPSGYFMEGMERLRSRYLSVPLDAVIHPVSTEVWKMVKEEQVAVDRALLRKSEDIKEIVKPVEEKSSKPKESQDKKQTESPSPARAERRIKSEDEAAIGLSGEAISKGKGKMPNLRPYGISVGILLIVILGIFGIRLLFQSSGGEKLPTATITSKPGSTNLLAKAATITLIPARTPTITFTPTKSEPIDYIIQEGDTLPALIEKFNLGDDGVLLLLDYNPAILENNFVFYVGQTITIPPPGTKLNTPTPIPADLPLGTKVEYKVLPGDTLAGIAAKFNSTTKEIIITNKIKDANALVVGQILQIPVNLVTPTAMLSAAATLGIGSTMTSPKDGMMMMYVPAGEFTMGSDPDDALVECQKYRSDCQRSWFTDEEFPHTVHLNTFWIGQTEVTNAMYAKCVTDGKCDQPSDLTYYNNTNYANHPVVYVSWNNANEYCSWTDSRLPTEAEWEKAASWNDLTKEKYIYPWGNEFDCKNGNFAGETCDGFPRTSPVGGFLSGVSPYGLYDMAGNVWEWVSSLYQSYPYSATDGRDDLSVSRNRVFRGGSWHLIDVMVRSALRGWDDPANTYDVIGFRCARGTSP